MNRQISVISVVVAATIEIIISKVIVISIVVIILSRTFIHDTVGISI